jgi:outer membrane protein TolC
LPTILELVLDAQRELYPNEDLLAQSRTTQTLNLIALYKALGVVLAIRHPAIEMRIENSVVGIQ